MATLYQIKDRIDELFYFLCDPTIDEEQRSWAENALNEERGGFIAKAGAYARVMQNMRADAESFNGEIKRLQDRKKATENAIERLRNNVQYAMESVGVDEVATDIGKWKLRDNPPSVNVLDEDKIPDDYKTPQPDKLDRRGLLNALKAGELIEGAELERKQSITFR